MCCVEYAIEERFHIRMCIVEVRIIHSASQMGHPQFLSLHCRLIRFFAGVLGFGARFSFEFPFVVAGCGMVMAGSG